MPMEAAEQKGWRCENSRKATTAPTSTDIGGRREPLAAREQVLHSCVVCLSALKRAKPTL